MVRHVNNSDAATHYSIDKTDHSLVDSGNSLVFSVCIKSAAKSDKTIGILGAFFDLEEEARIILQDYMPRTEDGDTCDGWFSFFTIAKGALWLE